MVAEVYGLGGDDAELAQARYRQVSLSHLSSVSCQLGDRQSGVRPSEAALGRVIFSNLLMGISPHRMPAHPSAPASTRMVAVDSWPKPTFLFDYSQA